MTDNIETIEGFTVGQVITVGDEYWISIEDNVTPDFPSDPPTRHYPVRVDAGDKLTILGFEQQMRPKGHTRVVAVVKLHNDRDKPILPYAALPGTVFLLPRPYLHWWSSRDKVKELENER